MYRYTYIYTYMSIYIYIYIYRYLSLYIYSSLSTNIFGLKDRPRRSGLRAILPRSIVNPSLGFSEIRYLGFRA